jgi:hypothetical protein
MQLQCGCGNTPAPHRGEIDMRGGSTMCKTFFLKPGHLARCDGLWYEPGILLAVAKGESVEVFKARRGIPEDRCGTFSYSDLDTTRPPTCMLGADKAWNEMAAARCIH